MTAPLANPAGLKAQLRQQVRDCLRRISARERERASALARERLARQRVWLEAKLILFFAPMGQELDLWPLASKARAAGRQVALPRFSPHDRAYHACRLENVDRDLVLGAFGLREPAPGCPRLSTNRLDLILVPGVAFDLRGGRLGRGHGYYDRLLSGLQGYRCGVAFDEQIVDRVPLEPHDALLNCILTPSRWVELEATRAALE